MSNKNTPPRWSLDAIYPGLESREYADDIEKYTTAVNKAGRLLDAFSKSQPDIDFPAWLSNFIETREEIIYLLRTLNAYSYIIYSTDTTNTAYLNNIARVKKLIQSYDRIELKFSAVLHDNSFKLEDFYRRFSSYAGYRYLLQEKIEETSHQMSAQEENLASDMSRTGGEAWGMLHEQIISNLRDEKGTTFNSLRNDAYSADPALRKSSWKKEIELLSQNRIAFAAALNNLKGETVTLNSRRNYNAAIDRALASNRLSAKTLDALISALNDALPMWRKYFQTKASLLRATNSTQSTDAGTSSQPGLAFYDLFAPLSFPGAENTPDSPLTKEWSFSEARDHVLKEYRSFSEDMYAFAKNAFDNNWIDAEVRQGKVGGAYDEDFPKGHQSRILSNFTGAFSDIITLAHELGHAYHFSCMKGKPASFCDYPMTLAETASTFAETLVKQDMISRVAGTERLRIIDLDLQDAGQVLVDILCRYYFEQAVFERREKVELNADDFCSLMKDAQEKTYGSGLNGERHEYMWAVKSHYYSTGLDFYNFPYAFGQLFAAGLFARFKKEGPGFAETYKELLSRTGNTSCEELCKGAGFDITTKDFWNSGIAMYAAEVDLFKAEAEKFLKNSGGF